jgi:hypothetical protein
VIRPAAPSLLSRQNISSGDAAQSRSPHRMIRLTCWKSARTWPRLSIAMLAAALPCRGKRVRAGSARGGASLDTRIERRKTGRHRGARAYEHPNLHPQPGRQRRAGTTGRRGSRHGGFPLSAGASHERGDKPRPAAIVCGCAGGS